MTLFKVTLHHRLSALNGEQWTNNFWVDQLGPATALDAADSLGVALMTQSIQAINIYRLSARAGGVGEASIRDVNIVGTRDIDPVNMIPFFNTVRLTLNDTNGRNESYYLRGYIAEENVAGFNISSDLYTDMTTDVLGGVLDVLGLRGPNGESISGGVIHQPIQMRQIGWNRRTRVGFHRGWVPD
jgi:hypothetical protein